MRLTPPLGNLLVPFHQPHLRWSSTLQTGTYHNPPQPFNLVGPTSPGGVHSTSSGRVNSGLLHLYNVLGLIPPPPKMSRYNQPRLRLHTGLRLGPRAPDNHRKPLFVRGTRHQPRAPEYHLSHENLGFLLDGLSTLV